MLPDRRFQAALERAERERASKGPSLGDTQETVVPGISEESDQATRVGGPDVVEATSQSDHSKETRVGGLIPGQGRAAAPSRGRRPHEETLVASEGLPGIAAVEASGEFLELSTGDVDVPEDLSVTGEVELDVSEFTHEQALPERARSGPSPSAGRSRSARSAPGRAAFVDDADERMATRVHLPGRAGQDEDDLSDFAIEQPPTPTPRAAAARARELVADAPFADAPFAAEPFAAPAPAPRARAPSAARESYDGPPSSDQSVVIRIVKSVVAHLPGAFKKAAEKSGLIALPGMAQAGAAASSLGLGRDDARAWRELRTAPIFDGLPNEALREALQAGEAQVYRLDRDILLPLDGSVALVRSGQVALGRFHEEVLAEERRASQAMIAAGGKADKKERKRRNQVGPLMRRSEQNLATFEEGDVVETSVGARGHASLSCFSVTPVSAITLARARVDRWRQIYPFMADRFRRAGDAARARVNATQGAQAVVADFFIRHGLSVSMTLRVRKLDTCIECFACEEACADRYGVKRLSLNGRVLGALDFVDACHTCTDQRCIDPCNFDAISFDADRREVLINEANCTGCTLCAVACPYDAIEMHDLDDFPRLNLRLDKQGSLKFGEGAGRKAKLRRIASKCDHCAFYEDQACISACPTGALLEVLPSDLVSQLPDQLRQTAKAGFDRTARIDINALNRSESFARKGLQAVLGDPLGRSRALRPKLKVPFWWAIGLLSVALVGLEIGLRLYMPRLSIAYLMATLVDGLDPDLALSRVDYRPGSELAINLGYVGTALMVTGLLYVPRRRLSFLRRVGSLRAWFEWHVLSGVIGPTFILMHSAAKLDNWVSIAFWSMVGTVLSGLLGRYLTTQLPERASTASVETLEVDRVMSQLRREHVGVRAADAWFEGYRQRVAAFVARRGKPSFGGAVATFFWVIKDDLGRGSRTRALKRALSQAVRGRGTRKVRRRARQCAERLARLERQRALLPLLEPMFSRWKAIHIPMAIALTVVATLHIVLALTAG